MKKQLKFLIITIFLLLPFFSQNGVFAQRKIEKLDRGVVVVKNNAGGYFISWRYFATDPEDIQFNVYSRPMGSTSGFIKLNAEPLTVTNMTATSNVGSGSQIYVTSVIKGVESNPSGIFRISVSPNFTTTYRSTFLDITYNPTVDGLELHKYSTKFVWPADLDGDGEYDYVVDRLSLDGGTDKVQGYLRNGQLLWTVDMGPNVPICRGHNDMVIAHDMDGDNKAEVIIKSSDGTIFSDGLGVKGTPAPYDTDNDGIINYDVQNVKNQPSYISVIDGMTGKEKNTIEMKYPSNYTRFNKSIFMGTEYSSLNGHMIILYQDGKHPVVGFVYLTRTSADQRHWYYASSYGYDQNGNWTNWWNWERGTQKAAEAHGLRGADADLDGRDELLDIGYGLKYDGTFSFQADVSHGDRFRVGDINPERPGLETFAIQQNNGTMLGQLLYDAATGEPIKKLYMSGVGDVGRGECMDVDPKNIGYEFWSTMANIYNAKGDVIYEGGAPFPFEGIWWDGELDREQLSSPDGDGANAMVQKFNSTAYGWGSRLIEFAKMTNYAVRSEYGVRPAFFGDMIGDWREEVILEKRGSVTIDGVSYSTCPGIAGFSTDYPTQHRIYCLMQNPAYKSQSTARGYYQSPFPDFYLGYDMPTPPVSPVQEAKLTWKYGAAFDKVSSNFVLADEKTAASFADGDDVMFDISGNNSNPVQLNLDLAPSKIWAMNPKGKDYTLEGTGKLTGTMELVKSLNGKFTLNGDHTYTGKTIISEGTLCLNGSSNSLIDIRAKGTLSGNVVLNGGLIVNPGLNVEGGRLAPGNGSEPGKLGKIVVNDTLTLPGKSNIEIDILPEDPYKNDSVVVNGDLIVQGVNTIVVNGNLQPGTYTIVTWTGTLTGSVDNFNVVGIVGLPVRLVVNGNNLQLVVEATRSASNVTWTGATDTNWDYLTPNFNTLTVPHQSTFFVLNDSVVFDDTAVSTDVLLNEPMIASGVKFSNNSKAYTFTGAGGIAGDGVLEKTGKGLLDLGIINSTFTGKTIMTNALVRLGAVNQTMVPGPLGQASAAPANWIVTDSRLIIDAVNSNTDRGMTIIGTDTIEIPKSNGVVSITGAITGSGGLVKSGPGQLNVSSTVANTYTGETVINGGTVGLGTLEMNRTGFGKSGKIRMENGARIRMFDNSGDYNQKPTWYITIPENNTARIDASSRCNINGTISGAGTLTYYTPYVRADLVAGGIDFTGTINVITDADGGDFRITANSQSFPNAAIILNNNVRMGAYASVGASGTTSTQVVRLGSLSGAASSEVYGGTYYIGTDNRNAIFSGTLKSGGTFTKLGTGKWTINGTSETTSSFTVSDGILEIRNATGSATGTGNVSVTNSAMLMGNGIIAGNVILSYTSKIRPGISETSIGTLNLNKNLTLTQGATAIMKTNASNNDLLNVGGTIYLNGTLEMKNYGAAWVDGASFKIMNAPVISGSFATILPEIPGEGLVWDTSRMNEGIIAIRVASGVSLMDASKVKIYPQPVVNHCFISLENEEADDILVEVFNANGGREKVSSVATANNQIRLDMSHLSSGVYVLKLTNAKSSIFTCKLMKK